MALDYPEQHRKEALIATIVLHALLGLLFYFMAFNGPNPPLEAFETGGGGDVELNYGLDPEGDGDVQTTATANASENRVDSKAPALSPDPQTTPAEAESDPTPPSQAKIITSDAEDSPVSETPVETPAPAKEEVKETPKPQRKVAVTFSPKGSNDGGGNGTNGSSTAATGNNNGDRPGKVGDQGDPKGSLDAKALYGTGGTGGGDGGGNGRGRGMGDGDGLDMSGWRFETPPRVDPIDDNPGVVRFKIKITEDGEVESVTKVSGNVSPAQEKLCRDKLLDANFVRTNSGSGGATGFYTFRFSVR
ncbi:hypothetical protein GCM10023185_21500 [Hymenobacter saemangeumensis]|uniref:Energy transducer TonB n=1 Tax=Hymenobacter saemangeumensis TaxID=1084522 RepID=A0ABP8IEB9_9BACT